MEVHVTAAAYTKLAKLFVREFEGKDFGSLIFPLELGKGRGEIMLTVIIERGHTGLIHSLIPVWWDISGILCDFDFEIFEAFVRYENFISRL